MSPRKGGREAGRDASGGGGTPGRDPDDRGEAAGGPAGGDGADRDEAGLEERLRRLEEIVSSLEADEVDLDRALTLFEEGIGHVRAAERILAETEMRVEELLEEGGRTRPLDAGGEGDGP